MLVLSRKSNQSIIIDGQVTVTVLAIKGNRVRIGIQAPPRVNIHRAELEFRSQEFEFAQEAAAPDNTLAAVG
jgi:carbon storage regulator